MEGNSGWDWGELTDNYVDERVSLAWGYKHHGHYRDEDDEADDGSSDGKGCLIDVQRYLLPDEDMFLMIGFRDISWSDPRTLTPARQHLITKLWKAINDWKKLCLLGKWTTLISVLQSIHEEGGTIQETDNTFTFASSVSQIENAASRKRAEAQINDTLDWTIMTEIELHDFGNHFQEWVFSPKNLGLTVEERIYLVANIWRRRVPLEKYQLLVDIQAWVTSTRKMMRDISGLDTQTTIRFWDGRAGNLATDGEKEFDKWGNTQSITAQLLLCVDNPLQHFAVRYSSAKIRTPDVD
ncbi:hypothetical protein NW768_004061 [Fusarium equiseti]|uniref:Uncharacterized protein n=1 Tax=Fusarium equiseti TaxID=61235 RepID=A0ABQ8RJE1_FUSEQ|nr:hypothetical protein NW768_004061 [Fusarium equiseti]